jgi:hypothetical protein
MKVILNESKFNTIFSEWLEKEKINLHILYYGSDLSQQDGLVEKGLVKFSQGDTPRNIERIGFSNGHIFVYKKKDNELTFIKMSPGVTSLGGMFKIFPPEMVEEYFSEQVKEYMYEYLNSNNSKLFFNKSV